MSPKHVLLLLIIICCLDLLAALSWSRRRRRRRRCDRRDCKVSPWSNWSACSAVRCGKSGRRHRTRTVQISPMCSGTPCPLLQEVAQCQGTQWVDCKLSSWSAWSACSEVQCGKWGSRHRTRTMQVPALCGGTSCPSLQEVEPCQGTLRVDCKLSSWSTWSLCTQVCGGSQTSTRYVVTNEQCGGTPCNTTLSKRQPCNITRCLNQGTLIDKKCSCSSGYYGSCCQYSVSEIPACNNCCSNTTYTEINNPRRSTKSSWNIGENALCDRDLQLGWYRFTSFAGGKIPERMVGHDHCGTRAPVWLNGRHPTKKGQNVVRQACVNKLNLNHGCWEFFDINIMNCGDYFVYYLRPPDYCSVAYCAGYMKPCPYGKEGEPPNCVDPPEPFSSDNLDHPKIN